MDLGTHLALPASPIVACHVRSLDQWFSSMWLFLTTGIHVHVISKDIDLELMIREWFRIHIPVSLLIPISVLKDTRIDPVPIYRWIIIVEQFIYSSFTT